MLSNARRADEADGKKTRRPGLLIDFDYAAMLDESNGTPAEGHRTVS